MLRGFASLERTRLMIHILEQVLSLLLFLWHLLAWISCGSVPTCSSCTATGTSSCDLVWYEDEHIETLLDSIEVKLSTR
jgi:hypothetical protein